MMGNKKDPFFLTARIKVFMLSQVYGVIWTISPLEQFVWF